MSDEERAPLLADDDGIDHGNAGAPKPDEEGSFLTRALNQPLTPLARILLYVSIALLLLLSVFIGLFAGVEHRLSENKGSATTITKFITTTVHEPTTSVLTATHTQTATTTKTQTRTVAPPTPTLPPKPVRSM